MERLSARVHFRDIEGEDRTDYVGGPTDETVRESLEVLTDEIVRSGGIVVCYEYSHSTDRGIELDGMTRRIAK